MLQPALVLLQNIVDLTEQNKLKWEWSEDGPIAEYLPETNPTGFSCVLTFDSWSLSGQVMPEVAKEISASIYLLQTAEEYDEDDDPVEAELVLELHGCITDPMNKLEFEVQKLLKELYTLVRSKITVNDFGPGFDSINKMIQGLS